MTNSGDCRLGKEDFDDASWKQAVCVSGPSSVMSAQIMPAIEID